jgi:hypothetical protein
MQGKLVVPGAKFDSILPLMRFSSAYLEIRTKDGPVMRGQLSQMLFPEDVK